MSSGNLLAVSAAARSEEHTSELQSRVDLVCRLLLEKKNNITPTLLAFFFNDPATSHIYTLSLHDALPIFRALDFLLEMVVLVLDLAPGQFVKLLLERRAERVRLPHHRLDVLGELVGRIRGGQIGRAHV